MDSTRLKNFIETFWDDSILPSITDYIRIPNKSPAFDPKWAEHGYMEDAVKLMEAWARPQLRPAVLRRPSHRPYRQPVSRGLPRLRLRRLRAAVAHHVIARRRLRHAHRARADRRRALGRCVGDRALVVPADAPAAVAHRGR